MSSQFIGACMGAFRLHPQMTAFVLLLAFCGGSYAVSNFADKSEVRALNYRMDTLELKIERSALDSAIRAIQSEIYGLERLVASGEATSRDVNRLASLRVELSQKQRELQRLERSGN